MDEAQGRRDGHSTVELGLEGSGQDQVRSGAC